MSGAARMRTSDSKRCATSAACAVDTMSRTAAIARASFMGALVYIPRPMSGPITEFIKHHYRHFNAAAMVAAADDYSRHLDRGGKMLVTIAGAMSTAEIGLSLAEMIRQDKVHLI